MSTIENIYSKYEKMIDKLFTNDKDELLVEDFKIENNLLKRNNINLIFNKLNIVTITSNAILPIVINFDIFIKLLEDNKDIELSEKKFYNSRTFKILINDNKLNVKYFQNGSLQITGCKDINNINSLILFLVDIIKKNKDTVMVESKNNDYLLKLLQKYKINELKQICEDYFIDSYKKKKNELIKILILNKDFIQKYTIKPIYNSSNIDNFNIKDSQIRISMINSSYSIQYEMNENVNELTLDRQKLFTYLKSTKVNCYYDNTQHQGVKINFMYNNNKNGICNCKESCILKKNKERNCKKITILIFQSGKIVITGSNDIKQNELCYDYLNNIISENYNEFLQTKI